ncbi:MAG: hypothetical protein AABW89_05115 [Nanoarchaeota archaeon]
MTLKLIIASGVLLTISYFLKQGLETAACQVNTFACFLGFIAYSLPTVIVIAYWVIKIYPHVEPYLTK